VHAVIVGAGKVGCGYLAPLFREAGHDVVLACRTPETATKVRSAGGWRTRVTGPVGSRYDVRGVVPLAIGTTELNEAVAAADLIAVSVGVGNVAAAAEHLVPGLAARRGRPVDVWVVENGDCAPRVRQALEHTAANRRLSLPEVGVAGAVASVVVSRGSWDDCGVPEFVGDAVRRLAVDGAQLLAGLPELPGVRATWQYRARLHEKLFVFNACHALTAYLGWLHGNSTVASAVSDALVGPLVAGALLEARRATLAAYPELLLGRTLDQLRDVHTPVAEALARYGDEQLADPVTRVGRQPLRKLSLLGAVAALRDAPGPVPDHITLGISAALLYGYGDEALLTADSQARRLHRMLEEQGVTATLATVCGLDPQGPVARAVADCYHGIVHAEDGVRFPPAAPHRAPEAAL
jgi:mannitol-1-phosphate 5-dehydrogenase